MARTVVDAEFVQENEGKLPIIDVRTASMYQEGHIPTAVNIDYIANEEAGTLDTDFVQSFKDLGLGEHDQFIVYCLTGMHAGLSCDELEEKGFDNVLYYRGSFRDWSSDPSRPIETE